MSSSRKSGPGGTDSACLPDGVLARSQQEPPWPLGLEPADPRLGPLKMFAAAPPAQWVPVTLTRRDARSVARPVSDQPLKIVRADDPDVDAHGRPLVLSDAEECRDIATQLVAHPESAARLEALRGPSAFDLAVWTAEHLEFGTLMLLVHEKPSPGRARDDPPPGPLPGPGPTPGPVPAPKPPDKPEVVKAIKGRFTETPVKCGDPGHVEADGTNISEGASTRFAIRRVRDKAPRPAVAAPMNGQSVRKLDWKPKRPADWQSGDEFTFDVTADGQSAVSENLFKFFEYPDVAAETKTIACASGVFGWTGKFDIAFSKDVITVTVKIKLVNRLGAKPEAGGAMPAAGDPVTAEDKAAMKSDIEGKLSRKTKLHRKTCSFGDACSCPKPIVIVVDFVEAGEHHVVNLFQGAGRANATNWTRVKTRDNSWAHETGHLLAWYDEYTGGAVGSPPRWKPNEAAHVMKTGLTVPPEYAWDFRDWYNGKSGEEWTARA